MLNGIFASAAWETACTYNAGKIGDPFIQTSQPFTKVFYIAYGRHHAGNNIAKLHHPVREPARKVDMVPALADQSLLSGTKFSDAGYISICNDKEVNIYDGCTARILVSERAVLKGCKCPRTKLWRVPLQPRVTNLKTNILLLYVATGNESLNSLYSVPSTDKMISHLEVFNHMRPSAVEAINNIYELPIIEPAISYLHGATGFPTKATLLKSIWKVIYLT